MKINSEWMRSNSCGRGLEWFCHRFKYEDVEVSEVIKVAIKDGLSEVAMDGIVKVMTGEQLIDYSIFSSELALPVFDALCPKDKTLDYALSDIKNRHKVPLHHRTIIIRYDNVLNLSKTITKPKPRYACQSLMCALSVFNYLYNNFIYNAKRSAVSACSCSVISCGGGIKAYERRIKILKYGASLLESESI